MSEKTGTIVKCTFTKEWKNPKGLRGCGFFGLKMIKLFIKEVIGINHRLWTNKVNNERTSCTLF